MLLTELLTQKMEEDTTKRDIVYPPAMFRLGSDYKMVQEQNRDGSYRTVRQDNIMWDKIMNVATQEELGFTLTGYSQLCSQLGVPFNFLQKCDPILRKQIMDKFLIKNKNERLLRLQKDNLRAVLSPRYAIINDSHVLQVVNHFLSRGGMDDMMTGAIVDDDNMFRLQVLDKKKEVIEGTFAGLSIKNSETGYSSLEVGLSVFTKVCSNGLILPRIQGEGYRRKHLGTIDFGRFQDYLSYNVKALGDNFGEYQRMFERADRKIVDRNVYVKYVEELKEFPQEWREGVIARAIDNATQWKFASDWTELAQQYPSMTRLKIEEEAGKFLVKEFK